MAFFSKIKDTDIELAISKVLRYGVYLALLFAIIGGVVYLYRHGNEAVGNQYAHYIEKDDAFFDYVHKMFVGIFNGKGRDVITLGIIVLLATPTVRILFSLFGYALEKDKMYMVITLIVLAIISVSVMGGLG
ncbi:MAG: DUF1634 domain-containing protein [Pseudopedobacter saltans]|uniref:DUF1634 domain-containing protein n=1 Tax=Pseudopedobacter saltans TaxID=151895 RepID=A0A2W5FA82_9SPHI|nr:MAG: DUF1634 domain-containing protein [Pseudopedobacter saltans]